MNSELLDRIVNVLESVAGYIAVVLAILSGLTHGAHPSAFTNPEGIAAGLSGLSAFGLHHAQNGK